MGLGKHSNADRGENGVWIGPFEKKKQAQEFAKERLSDKRLNECKHCK